MDDHMVRFIGPRAGDASPHPRDRTLLTLALGALLGMGCADFVCTRLTLADAPRGEYAVAGDGFTGTLLVSADSVTLLLDDPEQGEVSATWERCGPPEAFVAECSW